MSETGLNRGDIEAHSVPSAPRIKKDLCLGRDESSVVSNDSALMNCTEHLLAQNNTTDFNARYLTMSVDKMFRRILKNAMLPCQSSAVQIDFKNLLYSLDIRQPKQFNVGELKIDRNISTLAHLTGNIIVKVNVKLTYSLGSVVSF